LSEIWLKSLKFHKEEELKSPQQNNPIITLLGFGLRLAINYQLI